MDHCQSLPVTLTDGHTRAYIAYKNGVSYLPVIYDNDDMITSKVGQLTKTSYDERIQN